MKITLVNNRYWPSVGGCENAVRFIANELSLTEDVVAVTVINDNTPATPASISVCAPGIAPYSDGGVKVFPLSPSLTQRIMLIPTLVYYLPRLRRYCYDGLLRFGVNNYKAVLKGRLTRIIDGSDIVHAYGSGHLSWAALEAARSIGAPFVVTPVAHPGQYGDGPLDIELYNKADMIIAWLDKEKEFYISKGVDRAKIHIAGFPNVMPRPEKDKDGRQGPADIKPEEEIILYVGRMAGYKGVGRLIEAAALLPEFKFVFIGPMEEPGLFNKKTDNVFCPGYVPLDELADWYEKAAAICLVSDHEILPNVILEAWQFKKPVIVSDIPYLKCLVDNGAAGIIAADGVRGVKEAILKAIEDKLFSGKLGEAGYKKWRDNYTPDTVKTKTMGLYERLKKERYEK